MIENIDVIFILTENVGYYFNIIRIGPVHPILLLFSRQL